MPVTFPSPATTPPRPKSARPLVTLEELLRRAAVSVERRPTKLVTGTFRPAKNGRTLTRMEKGLMLLLAGGLGLAIWLHARPEPVSAHATHYRSLAFSTRFEASAPQTFAESALQAVGSDWRPETFFACTAPAFWEQAPAIHDNARAARIEQALAGLAGHGALVGLMAFPDSTAVETAMIGGVDVLAGRVAGQLELADGAVVRFDARLMQDPATRRWGFVDLSIPGFLP